jgi:hypothetical protein
VVARILDQKKDSSPLVDGPQRMGWKVASEQEAGGATILAADCKEEHVHIPVARVTFRPIKKHSPAAAGVAMMTRLWHKRLTCPESAKSASWHSKQIYFLTVCYCR